ncbi:pyridoxal phosphate-dependent transferase [Bombardia bombarda]|uniref:histidinol-phosphate transaminase n=1 Tax=Bombardia bombarda TaxID=252184 RepID=A0AA39WGH3_9PEZI|nr:pyridoxal phosphate-dependent transferase [Bombardia bombarda]
MKTQRQPDLQAIFRPNVLLAGKYATPTETQRRPRTLLDANENSLGSCLVRGSIQSNGKHGTHLTSGLDLAAILFSESLSLHRYPSAAAWEEVKQQIVLSRGLSKGHVRNMTLGTGGADLIDLLIRATCTPSKDALLVTPPTFPLYAVRAALNDVEVLESKLRFVNNDFQLHVPEILDMLAEHSNVKLVFLASPGNPTGSLIPLDKIRQILDSQVLKGLLIVDEAYIDFAPNAASASALQLLERYPNLVILQTLSKSHGLAGLRLGVAYAHEMITSMLTKVQMPFSISSPTAALAAMALSPAYDRANKNALLTIMDNRDALVAALREPELTPLGVGPPIGGNAANFVILPFWSSSKFIGWGVEVAVRERDSVKAKWVAEVLKTEYDTAVRYIGDAKGCEGCLRITIGTREENEKLVHDMISILGRQ